MGRADRKTKRRIAVVLIFAVIIIAGALLLVSLRQDRLYTVTVLPALGGKATLPCAINDRGQIVGLAQTPDGKNHIFLWDHENGMKDLGSTEETDLDINNAGQIAGTTYDPNGNSRAFLWDPNDGRKLLGTLGGEISSAFDLNNNGQIVGFSEATDGKMHAFIWDKANGMRQLGTLGRIGGNAHAINDSGQVIGFTENLNADPGSRPKPCYWDSTDAVESVPLPDSDDYTGGSGINNRGYVLDRMFHWDKFRYWVYLWKKDTDHKWLFELEHPIGSQYLNDANQVLYGEEHYSPLRRLSPKLFPPYPQYYLWDPQRGRISLDVCVKSKTGKLLSMQGLNNKGCVIGVIRSKSGVYQQAVLFEPIPERWEK